MQALLGCGKRNSTAEITEPAEAKRAQGIRKFQKKTSGVSASSSFILLSSCAEDLGDRREEEMGTASSLFSSFRRKGSAVSAYSAVQFFSSSLEGAGKTLSFGHLVVC